MVKRWLSFPVAFLVLLSGCASGTTPGVTSTAQPSTTSQPTQAAISHPDTWIKTFEGPDYGAFFDVISTPDGDLLTVGATNHLHVPPYSGDALIMELNLEGEALWKKTWGGDGYEQAISVVLAEDGGYYIFGETDSYGAGDRDFFLLKVTAGGTQEWYRTYGRLHREWPYGMRKLSNGDLLIYGFSESEISLERNQYAVRVSPGGDVIWEYIGESPEEELVTDALETEQGDLVLAVIAGEDGELVKLDSDGSLLWAERYELPGWQYASHIAPTGDGGFMLVGFSMNRAPQQADTWLARCNSSGELLWEISYGDPSFDDYAVSLIRLNDGTYLMGDIGNGMLLTRADEDGNILWRHSLVGQTVYGGMALLELEQGGFIVAGLIQLINGRSYDAILLRTDENGLIGE
jgi:hypothetical protein